MSDLTVVVTGASSGIGTAAAEGFARRGARVALVGRDPDRLAAATERVRAAASSAEPPRGFPADFEVFADVRRLAEELAEAYPTIDVLCNNAGAVIPARQSTVDGHERTIQANHLAPFLLTNLLRERLAGAPPEAVTNGGYYVKRHLKQPAGIAADPAAAAALWKASVEATGL